MVNSEYPCILQLNCQEEIPGFAVGLALIKDIQVTKTNSSIQGLKTQIITEAKSKFVLGQLKDDPIIRAYRDFYWRIIKIDPTKIRPAGEALLRRILQDHQLPIISNVVDAYNLGSICTRISFGAYDAAKLVGPLTFRKARSNEKFQGIGMNEAILLKPGVLLLCDQDQTLCVYPYRDANSTKITGETQNLLLVAAGVPNIPSFIIEESLQKVAEQVLQVAGGSIEYLVIKTLP